ncbi:MAG: AraC family transcriptional regulator [bacterium]|nr:AraC family transcriptional regulator [bacterium]
MRAQTHESYQERILRVLVHIQGHLDEALCLEELAGVAHFSPYHFHRVFAGMVGEGVKEHVRRLRLERAAYRLKATDHPVTRIAFEAGYETHESFTRAFKARFAKSPSQFREVHRVLPLPESPSGVHFAADGQVERFDPVSAGGAPMDVEIKKLDAKRVAFIRHVGPYNEVGATWQKLCAWAGPKGLLGPQSAFVGLCHDDPDVTPPDKIRYDACVAVGEGVTPEGEVGVQEIAGGDYAMTVHHGPYEKLGQTYAGMCGQWLPGSGREMRSAPSFELYLNSPMNTAREDLLTEVHVPLV